MKAFRCQWCGEHPSIVQNSILKAYKIRDRVKFKCGCLAMLDAHNTKKEATEAWNKVQKSSVTRQDFVRKAPFEDLPKYINYHVAYSRFIAQKRLAGEDYSVEAYNK